MIFPQGKEQAQHAIDVGQRADGDPAAEPL
jgi:hypothetical protein